ncbi:MAG: apolipoprotein N-acyltransferase [Phycisphaerales bacterium]|nr:apolipoprotein N-acyltransferase [Phycisphaerales bacterium]
MRRHPLSITIGLGVLHAILFVIAFPPIYWFWTMPLAIAALTALALFARSARSVIIVVIITQTIAWMVLHRWLIDVTAVGWAPLGVYLSMFGVAYAMIIRRLAQRERTADIPLCIIVPVVWVGVEYVRGSLLMDGYPWYFAAHPMIEWPALVQTASWLGAYFVSALVAVTAGAMIDASRHRRRVAGAAFVITAIIIVIGVTTNRPPADMPVRRVLAVQTNVAQDNKMTWTRAQQRSDFDAFVQLTRDGVREAGAGLDLIVWPETMMPGFGLDEQTLRALQVNNQAHEIRLVNDLVALQREIDVPMVVGMNVYEGLHAVNDPEPKWAWDHQYNAAYLVEGDLPFERYDKVFLTPFGETMPYISKVDWLEEKLLAFGAHGMTFDLDAATSIRRLALGDAGANATGRIATPICFEDTVPSVCRSMAWSDGAKAIDLFVNVSNDGWFGGMGGGRATHAQVARFRCIEHRIPMVRAANTGHSVAFDSSGNIISRIGAGRYGESRRGGTLVAAVSLDPRTTLYARLGDLWGGLSAVATIGLILIAGRRRTG